MAARVRAMVLTKPKTLEPREFVRPAIGADDGLLRIEACGIHVKGVNPVHLAIVPGVPRVAV
jgi:hypothetical protein